MTSRSCVPMPDRPDRSWFQSFRDSGCFLVKQAGSRQIGLRHAVDAKSPQRDSEAVSRNASAEERSPELTRRAAAKAPPIQTYCAMRPMRCAVWLERPGPQPYRRWERRWVPRARKTHLGTAVVAISSDDLGVELFDGREMVMVHDMMRREFGLLPGVVAGTTPGAHVHDDRTDIIVRHIDWLIHALHSHHSTEDDHIWPLLDERCEQSALTALMERQHEDVAACLDTVEETLKT